MSYIWFLATMMVMMLLGEVILRALAAIHFGALVVHMVRHYIFRTEL
jgi:hypothetical protein